jgi:hypothetical protein
MVEPRRWRIEGLAVAFLQQLGAESVWVAPQLQVGGAEISGRWR